MELHSEMNHVAQVLWSLWEFVTSPEVASIASIVGAGISLYLLWTVGDLKRRLVFNARLPQLHGALQTNASKISLGLNDFSSQKTSIDEELSKCNSNLRSLAPKLRSQAKQGVVTLSQAIDGYLQIDPAQQTEDKVRSIYLRLNGVMQDLTNLSEDYKMEQS